MMNRPFVNTLISAALFILVAVVPCYAEQEDTPEFSPEYYSEDGMMWWCFREEKLPSGDVHKYACVGFDKYIIADERYPHMEVPSPVIPTEIEGVPVEVFCGDCICYGDYYIPKVVLPEGIKRICKDAFIDDWIDTLYIPSTVEQIDEGAFRWSSIDEIIIAEDNASYKIQDGFLISSDGKHLLLETSVATDLFEAIGEYIIPETVEVIESYSFYRLSTSVFRCSPNLLSIHKEAFTECSISKLLFSAGFENVEENAFSYCYIDFICFWEIPSKESYLKISNFFSPNIVYINYAERQDLYFDFRIPYSDGEWLLFWDYIQNGRYNEAMEIQKLSAGDSQGDNLQDTSEDPALNSDAGNQDESTAEKVPAEDATDGTTELSSGNQEESENRDSSEQSPNEDVPDSGTSTNISENNNNLWLLIVPVTAVLAAALLILKRKRK